MIRKKGKLPGDKIIVNYNTEYSNADIEIMKETISTGDKYVIIDDLMATGGTMRAGVDMIRQGGGVVVGCYAPFSVEPLIEICKEKIGHDVPIATL